MRMTLTNHTEYYGTYRKSVPTARKATATGRIIVFSPVLWILFFSLLTVIVKLLAK
jgi:hypothetical protein